MSQTKRVKHGGARRGTFSQALVNARDEARRLGLRLNGGQLVSAASAHTPHAMWPDTFQSLGLL